MAHTVHLTLTGPDGQIEGESSQVDLGRENTIECVHVESAVTNPYSASSGHPTGKRQFAPFKFRKRLDKASPLLFKALCQNSQLATAEFQFFRPTIGNNAESEEVFYTITLKNAFIVDIKLVVPDTIDNPGHSTTEAYEDVSLTFDGISWEHIAATEHETSWSGKDL